MSDEIPIARCSGGGKLSSVLLDTVLVSQLKKLDQIEFKGETHPFNEANIRTRLASKRIRITTGRLSLMEDASG
jgi:hypothetical protein